MRSECRAEECRADKGGKGQTAPWEDGASQITTVHTSPGSGLLAVGSQGCCRPTTTCWRCARRSMLKARQRMRKAFVVLASGAAAAAAIAATAKQQGLLCSCLLGELACCEQLALYVQQPPHNKK